MLVKTVWSKCLMVLAMIAVDGAWACGQPEAQFRGRVKSLEVGADQVCRMQLGLNFQWGDDFVSSQNCPLDLDEALVRSIRLANCEGLRVGDAVSGYLVWPEGSEDLVLE